MMTRSHQMHVQNSCIVLLALCILAVSAAACNTTTRQPYVAHRVVYGELNYRLPKGGWFFGIALFYLDHFGLLWHWEGGDNWAMVGNPSTALVGGLAMSSAVPNQLILWAVGENGHVYLYYPAIKYVAPNGSESTSSGRWFDAGLPPCGKAVGEPAPSVDVAVSVLQGIGLTDPELDAVITRPGYVRAFVRCDNGQVAELYLDITVWRWRNHQSPPGVSAVTDLAAVISPSWTGAMTQGSDGNLWSIRTRDGTNWGWESLGNPAGIRFANSAPGLTVSPAYVIAGFINDVQGNAWVISSSGGDSWSWQNLGHSTCYSRGTFSAVATRNYYIIAFAECGDDQSLLTLICCSDGTFRLVIEKPLIVFKATKYESYPPGLIMRSEPSAYLEAGLAGGAWALMRFSNDEILGYGAGGGWSYWGTIYDRP